MSLSNMGRYVGSNWSFYLPFYSGLAFITMVSMGTLSWMPTLMYRSFGISTADAGYRLGGAGIAGGVLAAVLWPWLVVRIGRLGRRDGKLLCLLASGILAVVPLTLTVTRHDVTSVIGGFFFAMLGLSSAGILAPLAVQTFGPRAVRARLTSIYILATGLFGYAVGPVLVVRFAALWAGAPDALGYGMTLNALVAGAASSPMFIVAIRMHADSPRMSTSDPGSLPCQALPLRLGAHPRRRIVCGYLSASPVYAPLPAPER